MKTAVRLATSAAFLAAMATPRLATWRFSWRDWYAYKSKPHAVPEIDASSGLLAVAAVAAMLIFAWERNRKRG
ncbi:VPEID-CTERM sorting domain-containing protein [Limimaricola soesokkakensis]|uniref:VPEID-CTERM sorting domain-containing protein n=1 Tax=Limimaricola soesokkakensis TaxID=1343159 RepID=UPI003513D3FE